MIYILPLLVGVLIGILIAEFFNRVLFVSTGKVLAYQRRLLDLAKVTYKPMPTDLDADALRDWVHKEDLELAKGEAMHEAYEESTVLTSWFTEKRTNKKENHKIIIK